MDFFLLVLLTAIMMIRPEELFPDLTGARLYLWSLIITAVVALPKLRNLFMASELSRRSIVVCVLGFFASLLISAMMMGKFDQGLDACEEFSKVVSYFLMLVAILDTPERLRQFMGWLVLLVGVVALVAALHYYEMVAFPLLPPVIVEKRTNMETGETEDIKRALASGIFGDPNDLCLILVLGMLCCVYQASSTQAGSARLFWLAFTIPLFLVLTLTGSRGGVLGLLAGFGTLIYAFFGLRAGLPLAVAGALAMLAVIGGRGADLSGGGTAHERLYLWQDGLINLLRHPVNVPFGLGPGWYVESHALLAHNSFINAYVELGLIGGGFFLCAFVSAFLIIDRAGAAAPLEPWAKAMKPAMLAIVVAYAAGCFSLSRHLVLPTYLVLGLACAYINLSGDPPPRHTVNAKWFRSALVVMAAGLAVLKLFTQLLGNLGV